MVQRYPSSGNSVEPELLPAPPPVANAVKLMYVGAAVSTVSLIISLADISGTKAAIRKAKPSLTATQVNQLNTFIISLAVVSGLIGVGLWLWMARANNQGKNPSWTSYEKIREVIEKRMFSQVEDLLPIISFGAKQDTKTEKQHADFLERMMSRGYTERQVRRLVEWYMRVNKAG